MTFRERLGAANRLQRSRVFKIVATIVIAIAAIATVSTYVVRQTVPGGLEQAQTAVPDARPDARPDEEDLTEEDRAYLSALEAGQRAIEDVFRAQADWKSVAFGAGAVAAMSIAVVWLGLGLTYLVLLAAAGAVGYPLLRFEATATVGQVFLGIVSLTEDRWLLETQVLTSRVSVYNEEPFTRSTPAFLEGAEQFIRDRQALDERFGATGAERA